MIAACFWTKNDHRLDLCAIRHHKRAHSGPSCSPPDDSSCLFEHKRRNAAIPFLWFSSAGNLVDLNLVRFLKVKYPISLSRGQPFYGYLNLVWFLKVKNAICCQKGALFMDFPCRTFGRPQFKTLTLFCMDSFFRHNGDKL